LTMLRLISRPSQYGLRSILQAARHSRPLVSGSTSIKKPLGPRELNDLIHHAVRHLGQIEGRAVIWLTSRARRARGAEARTDGCAQAAAPPQPGQAVQLASTGSPVS
jgi:hypothetical protein